MSKNDSRPATKTHDRFIFGTEMSSMTLAFAALAPSTMFEWCADGKRRQYKAKPAIGTKSQCASLPRLILQHSPGAGL